MNPDAISTDLATQAASLRRLAHDLLGDAHLAEDAVQDAMQAAIERPPRSRGALPAWLRTVVRRCALDLRRGEKRRRNRELLARSSNDTSHTHEQVELMQRVLAAVQALPEPYRTTVWQRYYEDRSPCEIAVLQREPVKTVKTRLWRALARLREVLDRQCGNRGAWIALMAPVGAAKQTAVLGAILMSAKTKLSLASLVCVAIALALIVPDREPTSTAPQSRTTASVAAAPDRPDREPATQVDALSAERVEAPPGVPGPANASTRTERTPSLALGGVVLDLDGQPVSGAVITWNDGKLLPRLETDAAGRFDGVRARDTGRVGVAGPAFVPVLEPSLFDTDQAHTDLTVVVARSVQIRGVVVDTAGTPVGGAQINVSLGVDARPRFARVLDRCADVKFFTMTMDDGRFWFARAPLAPTSRMRIEARGHRDRELTVDEAQHLDRFVLERTTHGDTLEGIVVDEHDKPVHPAVVCLPSWSVVVAADGTFRIELWKALDLPSGTRPELQVFAPNRLPGKLACLSPEWRSRAAWPREIKIRLGGVTETIAGRVARHDGTPVAQVHVTFAPPEPEQIRRTMFDYPFGDATVQSAALALRAGEQPAAATGAFETARVVPGEYRLRVFDPEALDVMLTEPMHTGGPEVVITMPDRGRWPALCGLVVDRRGEPVPNADWMVTRRDPLPGATATIQSSFLHANEKGVIEHPPLSRDVDTLCVKAAGMAEWVRVPIADLACADFRVVVPVGCRARIEVGAGWGSVDAAGFVDLAGNRSSVVLTHGNVAFGTRDVPLRDGRSETFTALDDCRELLLLRGGDVVGRVPVSLLPGEMNVLRP